MKEQGKCVIIGVKDPGKLSDLKKYMIKRAAITSLVPPTKEEITKSLKELLK